MTKSIALRKYQLIQAIINIENEDDLIELEGQIKLLLHRGNLPLLTAIKPLQKSISLEGLIEKQQYKPLNKSEFFRKTDELHIEEPLEKLLSMID